MRPRVPSGKPWLWLRFVQCAPPSVDLYSPLPGPPLTSAHGKRCASHIAAYSTCELCGSITRSIVPVLSSIQKIFCHVCPPSVDLKTPRLASAVNTWPNDDA